VTEEASSATEGRVLLVASLVAVGVLAGLLAVIGAFLSAWLPRPLGVPIPIGVVVAVVGNVGLGVLGSRWTGSRTAPVVSALIWVVIVLLLGSSRPEGDLVVAGWGRGVAFLLVGTAAAAAGIAIGPGQRRRRRVAAADPSGTPPTPSPGAFARR
jgi:hypothetical protein